MKGLTSFRIARPAQNLLETERFYVLGLGFQKLGEFKDHDGFDGVMLGDPHFGFHLEFTFFKDHPVAPSISLEDLFICYIPDEQLWLEKKLNLHHLGYSTVTSFNPYWDQKGVTFLDPNGYRIVLYNDTWPRH